MKIQSKFKDYYDYIAWQYGGGDEKCVYERIKRKLSVMDLITKQVLEGRIER